MRLKRKAMSLLILSLILILSMRPEDVSSQEVEVDIIYLQKGTSFIAPEDGAFFPIPAVREAVRQSIELELIKKELKSQKVWWRRYLIEGVFIGGLILGFYLGTK